MKKLFLVFAIIFSSTALSAQNLSANVRSSILEDGSIMVTYTNKPDKHFIKTTDNINYVITTEGRKRIMYASITPDSSGNKNVVIEGIKFTVNASGYVGNLSFTDNYSSVNSTNSCFSDYQAKCRQEWACTIVCAAGFNPGCWIGWAADCAAKAVKGVLE